MIFSVFAFCSSNAYSKKKRKKKKVKLTDSIHKWANIPNKFHFLEKAQSTNNNFYSYINCFFIFDDAKTE